MTTSLKQLAEDKTPGVTKATIFSVDPELVEFEPGFNLRDEGPELDAHLEAMYVAMKAGAVFPPIDVKVVDGKIIARDGHCRARVAQRLRTEGIPMMLKAQQFKGNEVDETYHILDSASGLHLTPLQQGRGYLRLVRYGVDINAIAERMHVSRTTIENGLMLAEMPVEAQQMVASGQIAGHLAITLFRKHGVNVAEAMKALLTKAAGGKVTNKQVGARVPTKVARTLDFAARGIRESVGKEYIDTVVAQDDTELDGHVVPIPAVLFKLLIQHIKE